MPKDLMLEWSWSNTMVLPSLPMGSLLVVAVKLEMVLLSPSTSLMTLLNEVWDEFMNMPLK